MTEPIVITSTNEGERRRVDRRLNARVGDLTLPELRRILITTTLGAVVLLAFLWMVRNVVIAAILGLIIGFYLRPLYGWILERTRRRTLSAILTLPYCPWLVVMGDADEVVDPAAVYAYLGALAEPPQLIRMPGTSHFFHGKLTELRALLADALRNAVP